MEETEGTQMEGRGARERDALTREANRLVEERGVRFGGEEGHAFRVDPVPRILPREEWDQVAAGVRQRVRALEAFLDDVYGERRTIADGVVPERVVDGSSYFERDLVGLRPAGGARISVAGLDLVRDADGRFLVLEDNVRTPSGIAYAMAASEAVGDVLDVESPAPAIAEEVSAALRRCMEAAAPDVDGELVLLSSGEHNSAFYEHRTIAEMADLVLATPDQLRSRGGRVELSDGRRVRTDDDWVRDESGELTHLAELLLGPLGDGAVGMANWFGTGVADDKSVYPYVDEMVRYFLQEEPLLPSVRTYDLADPERLKEVLDRLDELVVKPRDGHGGQGVVVGPSARPEEIEEARAL